MGVFSYVHHKEVNMSIRDRFDTMPDCSRKNLYITYTFSQPSNASPSFLAELLAGIELDSTMDGVPMLTPIINTGHWHRLVIKITKKVLAKDIEPCDVGDYLNQVIMERFASTDIFLTPKAANRMLCTANVNFLKFHGQPKIVNSGLLCAKKLLQGEKVYMLIFSLTTTPRDNIRF
jgi:hypothetical protein